MKTTVKKIRVDGAEPLIYRLAECLYEKFNNSGQNGVSETDWIELAGFHWWAIADIDIACSVSSYDHLTPPEYICDDLAIVIKSIDCTDEEGNYVDFELFDKNGKEIGFEELREYLIEMFQ